MILDLERRTAPSPEFGEDEALVLRVMMERLVHGPADRAPGFADSNPVEVAVADASLL